MTTLVVMLVLEVLAAMLVLAVMLALAVMLSVVAVGSESNAGPKRCTINCMLLARLAIAFSIS